MTELEMARRDLARAERQRKAAGAERAQWDGTVQYCRDRLQALEQFRLDELKVRGHIDPAGRLAGARA